MNPDDDRKRGNASRCTGWWQQSGLGRQPMENLELTIADNRIWGSGTDIVAPFTFEGRLREDGTVELIKQYQNRHSVIYVGQYDGEGTLFGTWDIQGYRGDWLIKFTGPASDKHEEIVEILPLPSPN